METAPEQQPHEREIVYRGDVFIEESRAGISTWSIGLEGVQEAEELKTRQFESFPDKLLALRKAFRQTQAGMAELIGIKEKTYQNWEQGIRAPRGPARRLLDLIFLVPKIAVLHITGEDEELSVSEPVSASAVDLNVNVNLLYVERIGTDWCIRHRDETEPISEHRARDEAVIRALLIATSESNNILIRLTDGTQ